MLINDYAFLKRVGNVQLRLLPPGPPGVRINQGDLRVGDVDIEL